MTSAADYRHLFDQAMQPEPGFNTPSSQQIQKATAYALAAISAAISEVDGPNQPVLDGITLHPATHHSA